MRGCSSVAEHLLNTREDLGLILSNTETAMKKSKKKNKTKNPQVLVLICICVCMRLMRPKRFFMFNSTATSSSARYLSLSFNSFLNIGLFIFLLFGRHSLYIWNVNPLPHMGYSGLSLALRMVSFVRQKF